VHAQKSTVFKKSQLSVFNSTNLVLVREQQPHQLFNSVLYSTMFSHKDTRTGQGKSFNSSLPVSK